MTDVAALIGDMVNAGVSAALIGRVAQALADREVITVQVKDEAAERRRERDREYRRVGRSRQKSADSPSPKDIQPLSEPSSLDQNPIPPPLKPPALVEPNEFPRFWAAYPNKVEKPAAKKLFAGAVKRAGGLDALLEGLERAKACRKWAEGYIPNPARWLRNDGWLDEPDNSARAPPMTGGMIAAASDEWAFREAIQRSEERDRQNGNHLGDQGVVVALPAPAAQPSRPASMAGGLR
jgi:hypothetical protein